MNKGSFYMTAPDLSVTITENEAKLAFEVFDSFDWDLIEDSLPPNALDPDGVPINRNNRSLRLAVMAENVQLIRGDKSGKGISMMDNPHYEHLIEAMLDAFDKAPRRNP